MKLQLLNQFHAQVPHLPMFANTANDGFVFFVGSLTSVSINVTQQLSLTTRLEEKEETKTEKGKPVLTNTPQMLLLSDTTGLHSNPAGQ